MYVELFLLLLVIWILCKNWTSVYSYWEKKGVPHLKGKFPLGSEPNNIFLKHYNGHLFQQIYNKLDPHPFGGFYMIREKVIIARDPEFIKKVLVKDFTHFKARDDFKQSSFLSKHLFSAEGDLWRALRVKMTPTFTSGKLKSMFSLFKECSVKLDGHLKQMANNGKDLEVKDWMARFTTDIICSCAFGLDTNSMEQPDNELRQIGLLIFQPIKLLNLMMVVIFLTFPFFQKIWKFSFVPKKVEDTLLRIITETVRYREQNNITRNDFLDLLIDIMKKDNLTVDHKLRKEEDQSEEEETANNLKMDLQLITAQCFVFFLAGFETASSVMSFCLYEMTMNPDIQDKVRYEIDEVLKKYNGDITYQALLEMSYLEQVIFETMRKYPTLPILSRVCTKSYSIPEMNLVIDEGTKVIIPVYALHHDPKYYPDPEKFMPERFAPENKSAIPTFAYLPFGEGPRICIGMRFGMLQAKTGIVTVLKYKLVKTESTPETLTFDPSSFLTKVKENIKLKIVNRDI